MLDFDRFSNYYNTMNNLVNELLSSGKSFYNDKEYIFDKLDEAYQDFMKDIDNVVYMLGDSVEAKTEYELIKSQMDSSLDAIKRMINKHITDSDSNNIKLCFVLIGINFKYDKHLVITEGTTHVLYHNAVKSYMTVDEIIDERLKCIKDNASDISASTLGDCKQLLLDSITNFVIHISDAYTKLTLPKSLIFLDKHIFTWIVSIKEIECYRSQLDIVKQAIEYNKCAIDDRMHIYLRLFSNINESILDTYKDIKITLLD